MEKTITYKFTKKDYELLNNIPDTPCTNCLDRYACCGCPKGRNYDAKMQEYKEAGIDEFAHVVKERENLIQSLQKAYDAIKQYDKENEEELDILKEANFPIVSITLTKN